MSDHVALDFAPPRRIEATAFTLRCWSRSDATLLREALAISDAHLRAWTPWVVDGRVAGLSLEERLERHDKAFTAGTEWVYGIFSLDGREVLGGCGLYPRVGPEALEIGYWLSVEHTGRGLATTAASELTRLAFAAPSVDRIEIHCAPGNTASNRVPARLGFQIVEHMSEGDDGAGQALTIWQLTRHDYGHRF